MAGDPAHTGGVPRLPTTLAGALARFEASEVLRAAMGDPLFTSIAAVRRGEAELFADAEPADIVAATRRRY